MRLLLILGSSTYYAENPWAGLLLMLGVIVAMVVVVLRAVSSKPKDKSQIARSESDWSIHCIPYDKPKNADSFSSGVRVMALIGLVMFVMSFVMQFSGLWPVPIIMAPVGFLLVMSSTLVGNRTKRNDWIRLKAVCLDKEHKRVWMPAGVRRGGGGYAWTFRMLCKFDLNGH